MKLKLITFIFLGTSIQSYASQDIEDIQLQINELKSKLDKVHIYKEGTNTNHSSSDNKVIQKNTNIDMKVYGFVRMDATFQAEGASTMYNNINATPIQGTSEYLKQRDQLRSTAAATRIGADFKINSSIGPILGKIETDFFGGATRDQFRMRHAYISLDKWLIGQTWSNFISPEYLPESIEPASYVGGSLLRIPQVKFSNSISNTTNIAISVEDPKYTEFSDPNNEMRLPAFVGRVNHKIGSDMVISARSMIAEKKIPQDKMLAWGIAIGGKYNLNEDTYLKGNYYHVKGDGKFVAWSNSGYVINENKIYENEFDAVSLGLTHNFNEKVRSTVGYGFMISDDNNDFSRINYENNSQNKQLWQGWVNMIYQPVTKVNVGVEYVYGERETFNELKGKDNRLNLMVSYDF